jgi:dihydroflavonol-4-reductase
MKAVVLGATGHLGNAILRHLLAGDWEVMATGRRAEPPPNLAGLEVRYSAGDADDDGQLDAWVGGHDLVVDAAAPYPLYLLGSAGDPVDHAERRIDALLSAVRRHGTILGYVSSFSTRPSSAAGNSLTARAARVLHPYFAVKERMERRVLAAARDGLPAIILNPTMCLGPWDARSRKLCLIPRLLAGEVPSSITHVINVIDVRDVALALVAAVEAERYGEPLLVSGHNIAVDALFRRICTLGNAAPPPLRAPTAVALAVAYWSEMWLSMAGQPALYPSLAMLLLAQFTELPPSPALADLGISPRPLGTTLDDAIEWFRSLGYC